MKGSLLMLATGAALSIGIVGVAPAQAITFDFNSIGQKGFSVAGSFSYDENTAPTTISESGGGKTNALQSLTASFFDPSGKQLATYNTVAGGVSESPFFAFNFNTVSQTLFGSFNVGGGTVAPGVIFALGTVGTSLSIGENIDFSPADAVTLDSNSGSIAVSPVKSVPEPEDQAMGGLAILGLTLLLKKKVSSKKQLKAASLQLTK